MKTKCFDYTISFHFFYSLLQDLSFEISPFPMHASERYFPCHMHYNHYVIKEFKSGRCFVIHKG